MQVHTNNFLTKFVFTTAILRHYKVKVSFGSMNVTVELHKQYLQQLQDRRYLYPYYQLR